MGILGDTCHRCVSGGEAGWEQRGGPAVLLALFPAAEKNPFLLLPLFPEHPDSSSRQALSRQHLYLNDFNELPF